MSNINLGERVKPAPAPKKEEREFVRAPYRFLLDYRECDRPPSQDEVDVSETRNISGNGVLIVTDRPIEIGLLLEISLRVPGWHRYSGSFIKPDWTSVSEPLILVGTAVRCDEIVPQKKYEVGVSFTHIDPGDRFALLRYLEEYDNPS